MSQAITDFHKALMQHTQLRDILTWGKPGGSAPIINIHRQSVPFQDLYLEIADGQRHGKDCIPPYLWYNITGTEFTNCLSGECWVDSYTLTVELVSFTLATLDSLTCAFRTFCRDMRRRLQANCFTPDTACPRGFTDISILDLVENYSPMNQIAADLGGYLSINRVEIYPRYSEMAEESIV